MAHSKKNDLSPLFVNKSKGFSLNPNGCPMHNSGGGGGGKRIDSKKPMKKSHGKKINSPSSSSSPHARGGKKSGVQFMRQVPSHSGTGTGAPVGASAPVGGVQQNQINNIAKGKPHAMSTVGTTIPHTIIENTPSVHSVQLKVEQIESGIKVIHDSKEYIINHGRDGRDGRNGHDGRDGKDGISPTIIQESSIPVCDRLVITSLSKSSGVKGEHVSIYGDGFMRGAFVLWGDTTLTDPWTISRGEIKVNVPKSSGASVVLVRVSNPNFDESNSVEFSYYK
jgi:hypothetical protein